MAGLARIPAHARELGAARRCLAVRSDGDAGSHGYQGNDDVRPAGSGTAPSDRRKDGCEVSSSPGADCRRFGPVTLSSWREIDRSGPDLDRGALQVTKNTRYTELEWRPSKLRVAGSSPAAPTKHSRALV